MLPDRRMSANSEEQSGAGGMSPLVSVEGGGGGTVLGMHRRPC